MPTIFSAFCCNSSIVKTGICGILSKIAIETAMALAKGEEITANQTVNFGKNDMPHVVVKSTVITKDNIDEKMIDTGYYSHKEIYGE